MTDGKKYRNGKFEMANVTRWYKDGELHRLDGPAVMWNNGEEWHFIEGYPIPKTEFKNKVIQYHIKRVLNSM